MSIEEEVRREGEAEERGVWPPGLVPAWSERQQQGWEESPIDAELRKLAGEYHDRCEAYDRTVCLQRNEEGVAIPTSTYELAMIGRFASRVKEELAGRALRAGATRVEFHSAIVAEARRRRGQ